MTRSSPVRRFSFAALAVVAAVLVRLLLRPWLGDSAPFLLFFPAIMAAAWFGGFGPGLFATTLSACAVVLGSFRSGHPLSFANPGDDLTLVLFIVVGATITHLNESLRQAALATGQLAAIVDSSEDAIVGKDLDGVITSWNHSAERLFGYTAAEAIGRSITLIIPDERRADEQLVLARIRNGQRVPPFETERVHKDGSRVELSISVSPIESPSGEIVGASKIARDITARRRSERIQEALLIREREATAAAVASRDRLRFLAEVSTLLTSSLDYEETLHRAVHVALPRLGDYCTVVVQDQQGHLGLVAWGHVVPAKEPALRELAIRLMASSPSRNVPTFASEVMRSGKTLVVAHERLRTLIATLDGVDPEIMQLGERLLPYAYAGVPLTVRGAAVGVLAFGTTGQESHRDYSPSDVELIEEFAQRVSLAVENARLFRKADELNRVKDEFLATVSHELRTPLGAILGWARMLAAGQLSEDKAKRAIEAIERNAQAQAQLVDDILDVARGMVGNVRLDPQPIDLPSVAQRGIEAIAPAAASKKIHVEMHAPSPVTVVGDSGRLQQVVWNLVSNAVKFTPPGGRVTIDVAAVDGHAELRVTDTGAGIPPAFLPYVFDKFRQADGSFTRQYGGLGLGLAIARHLVELHGGSVEAQSEGEGRGATFVVCLPLA